MATMTSAEAFLVYDSVENSNMVSTPSPLYVNNITPSNGGHSNKDGAYNSLAVHHRKISAIDPLAVIASTLRRKTGAADCVTLVVNSMGVEKLPLDRLLKETSTPPMSRRTSLDSSSVRSSPSSRPNSEHPRNKERFHCPYPGCDQVVSTRYSLKRHFKRHTGAKPYQCPEKTCAREFAERSTLQRHVNGVHRDRRPSNK